MADNCLACKESDFVTILPVNRNDTAINGDYGRNNMKTLIEEFVDDGARNAEF